MSTTITGRQIHKLDSMGRTRLWWAEYSATAYRTHAGIDGGAIVTSDWYTVDKGNQGRSLAEQVYFEVQALYIHKLTRDYFELHQDPTQAKVLFPMLAHKYDPKKFQPGYVQPKLDGMRCIAKADGLFSRQGKPIESCPHIVEALAPIFGANPELVLDGELYNHDLKHDFERLMSLCRKSGKSLTPAVKAETQTVQYHIYDVISAVGDAWQRLSYLTDIVDVPSPHNPNHRMDGYSYLVEIGSTAIVKTYSVDSTAEFDEAHNEFLSLGYEGSIWRAKGTEETAGYEIDKRSKRLLKRTDKFTQEFPVSKLIEGNGNWAGAVKVVECFLPDGRTFEANISGTYEANAARLGQTFKHVTVEFKGWTKDGKPRAAIVKDWDRDDVAVP